HERPRGQGELPPVRVHRHGRARRPVGPVAVPHVGRADHARGRVRRGVRQAPRRALRARLVGGARDDVADGRRRCLLLGRPAGSRRREPEHRHQLHAAEHRRRRARRREPRRRSRLVRRRRPRRRLPLPRRQHAAVRRVAGLDDPDHHRRAPAARARPLPGGRAAGPPAGAVERPPPAAGFGPGACRHDHVADHSPREGERHMARAAEAHKSTSTARPMTGEEYLDSLRDGREVWIYGERVDDVTTHPAFRNGARSVARLYDALHDPEQQGVLTVPTDTGSGGFTHPFFKAPMSSEDLFRGRDAIAAWQRLTYGWMGRSPDYKAAFLATYGPNADYYKPFEENARRWYREAQERVYFMNHTLVNPPVDRNKEIHEVDDIFIHAVKETDEGVVVRGAKMVATGSAYSKYNLVSGHGSTPIKKEEYALSFFAAMNAPGIKLICRPSYEYMGAVLGSPFDYPLSSRFDENDAVLVFEDALIPWENFLIYGNLEIASTYHLTCFIWRALMQGCTRLAVKLDFLAGLFIKAIESTGTVEFRGIQASIGEILALRNMFWALTDAMCANPVPSANGSVLPNIEA